MPTDDLEFEPPEEYDPAEDSSLEFAQGGMSLDEHEATGYSATKDGRSELCNIPGPMGAFWCDWFTIRDALTRIMDDDDFSMATLSDGATGVFAIEVPGAYLEEVRRHLQDEVAAEVYHQIQLRER